MDYAFLVGVLNRAAHREKKLQPLADRDPIAVAVLRDGCTLDVLHNEVRPAFCRRACVEDARDIWMVHHGQSLTLIGEAGEYLPGVHAEFDYFESHVPANGFALLGQVHRAHAAFPQRSEDVISDKVLISGYRGSRVDALSSRCVRTKRTIESALDQALRAQSRGIAGTQLLSALMAACHMNYRVAAYFKPFASRPCN
ncbi:MAG: hypothetical protein ABSC93_33010, partial [Bryobacteraceae bacterium]